MATLFATYSVTEIITFIILFALAVKGFINFYDWAKDKVLSAFNENYKKKKQQEQTDIRITKCQEELEKLQQAQENIYGNINDILTKLNLLVKSDKDSIKAYITQQYHYFDDKGWIDDYSLDCIERRFAHYQEEGGNSFIENLMDEIRNFPRHPPT